MSIPPPSDNREPENPEREYVWHTPWMPCDTDSLQILPRALEHLREKLGVPDPPAALVFAEVEARIRNRSPNSTP